MIEASRWHYNEVRPHSSLGYLTPAAFAAKIGTGHDRADGCDIRDLRGPPRRPTASREANRNSSRGSAFKRSVV